MNIRLCALLETSDGEYHICCGQFSSFRPWSLLLSNLKLRSRSLSARMDLMRNRANFALTDSILQVSEYRTGARLRAKIFYLPVGRPSGSLPNTSRAKPENRLCKRSDLLSVADKSGELLPGGFVFGISPDRVRVRVLRLLPIVHSEVIVAKLFMNLRCVRAAVHSPIKITLGAVPFPTPHVLLSCVKKTTQFEDLQFDRCIVVSVRCIEFTAQPVSVCSDNVEAILTQCDSTFDSQ